MNSRLSRIARIVGLLRKEQGGQVFAFFGIGLVCILGMTAFVVDVSRFYLAHRQLQASSDAVAAAVADQLADVKSGKTTLTALETDASTYGASSTQKNKGAELKNVQLTFTPKCLTINGSVPSWCTTSIPDAIQVKQTATVNSVFAKVVGINSAAVSATSTATMGGGKPVPAHIMLVLDRTGSMGWPCSAGGSKLQCAQAGVDAFLAGLDPAYDKVGLVVFSPASSSSTICSTPPSNNSWYDQSSPAPLWTVVGLSSDYKASATSPLNTNSTLYKTYHCIKAGGSTAYANAIDQAQSVLAANHSSQTQDVIVFFTDGEANYGSCLNANSQGVCSNNTSTYRTQPCHQAISSAAAAKTAGTWVYTIEYDSNAANVYCEGWKSTGSQNGYSCNVTKGVTFPCNEAPTITARATLQQMATDQNKFYEEPTPGSLTTIFQDIADDLGDARLVDDGYTGS